VTKASRLGWETQNVHENCPQLPTNKRRSGARHPLASSELCPDAGCLPYIPTGNIGMNQEKGRLGENWGRRCTVRQEICV